MPPRWLFLAIETADGTRRWAEPILEGRADTVKTAVEELMDGYRLDEDSSRIEDHWQRMYRGGFYRGGPVLMSAIAGIDQTLWDIKDKYTGEAVYDLLGGQARERVQVYKKIVSEVRDEVAELTADAVDGGFTTLQSPDGLPGVDDRIDRRSRRALRVAGSRSRRGGAGVDIGVDLHGHISAAMAPRLLSRIAESDPMFVKAPVRSEHLRMLDSNGGHDVPLAFGERLYSRWEFRPHLESGRLDVAQPDISHAGGITEIKNIAAMAESYGAQLMMSCSVGPIAYAAATQLILHLPNAVQQPSLGEWYADAYVENVDDVARSLDAPTNLWSTTEDSCHCVYTTHTAGRDGYPRARGDSEPLTASPPGKAVLAHLPPDRCDHLVGVDSGELPPHLETLRERQVLVEPLADAPEWVSIATPVLDPSDSPIAAIEVVIPSERATGIDVKNNIKGLLIETVKNTRIGIFQAENRGPFRLRQIRTLWALERRF